MRAVLALVLIAGGMAWAYAIASGRWPHVGTPAGSGGGSSSNGGGSSGGFIYGPPPGHSPSGGGGGSQLR